MTEHAATAAAHAEEHHEEHIHPASYYVKTWAILVVLLAISFAGPFLGIKWVTLTTAFGIAIVKCFLVCARFMHLNIEKRLASMIVLIAVVLMGLFFSGVSPDIMKHEGDNWVNIAANAETVRRIEREGADGKKLDEEVEKRLEEHEHGGGAKPEGAKHE
jgi:caa(3)-type oxidase subunit IV